MIGRWITRSIDLRGLTRYTWKAPYTRLWWIDFVIRRDYVRPILKRLDEPVILALSAIVTRRPE